MLTEALSLCLQLEKLCTQVVCRLNLKRSTSKLPRVTVRLQGDIIQGLSGVRECHWRVTEVVHY